MRSNAMAVVRTIFLQKGDEECIHNVNNWLIRFGPAAEAFVRRNKSSTPIEDREFHY
jgi:hypothetical protein